MTLDHFEVAKITSKASGRTIVYHSLTEEQMLEGARSQGMLYSVVRAGHAAGIASYPELLTGQEPLTFDGFTELVNWKKESRDRTSRIKDFATGTSGHCLTCVQSAGALCYLRTCLPS